MNSSVAPRQALGPRMRARAKWDGLVEGVRAVGVDGVADARDGAVAIDRDLLGARGGKAGGVAAAEVVDEDGVVPVGLDGGVAVVGALCSIIALRQAEIRWRETTDLVAVDGPVHTRVEVRSLIVVEPILMNVVNIEMSSTCKPALKNL